MRLPYFADNHAAPEESDDGNGNLIDNPGNYDSVDESANHIAEEMPAKINAAVADGNGKQEAQGCVPFPFEEQGGDHCKARYVGGVVGNETVGPALSVRSPYNVPGVKVISWSKAVEIRLDDVVPGHIQNVECGTCGQQEKDENSPAVEIAAPSEPVGSSGQGIESDYHENGNQGPLVGQEKHYVVPQRSVPAVYGSGQRPVEVQNVVYINHYL